MSTLVQMPVRDPESTIKAIDKYVTAPPENSRVFTITPAVAEYILNTYNLGNRPEKPTQIGKYARHMQAGTFKLTGDTLKFSDKALLRDGQHRLLACIAAGVPFRTHIVFGIPDDAFALLDQNKIRLGGDVLAIAGYKNTNVLAAAVRWAWLIDEGRVLSRKGLEPAEVLRLLQERYPTMPDYVPRGNAVYRAFSQPGGVAAAMIYLFTKANPAKAEEFAEAWMTGANGAKFSPIRKMQDEIRDIANKASGRVHDVVRAALIVQAWNLFVAGRRGRPADFDWKIGNTFPAIAKG